MPASVILAVSPRLQTRAGAFKLFQSPTTGMPDPPESRDLPELLARLAPLGLPVSVHAEDPAHFSLARPPLDPVGWNSHRPPAAERAALERLLPAPVPLRLHVAHVTTPASATRLREAGVSFEATAHHLLLTDRSGRTAYTKVNPPLRSEADRRGLWDAFVRGEVPILASDHAPHLPADKERPFGLAPSGMPGVETLLPLMLGRVRASELTLPVLLAAACDRPARWLGQPQGRIAPGHRAHLLVVDFRQRTTVTASRLHAPCGWTAFEGREAIFPREVYFRGERIVAAGEFVGELGVGSSAPSTLRTHRSRRGDSGRGSSPAGGGSVEPVGPASAGGAAPPGRGEGAFARFGRRRVT